MARPKLKDGERGNYNVSRKEQKKRTIQKRLNSQRRTLEKESKKVRAKREKIKQNEERLKVLKNGGVTSDESLGVVLEDNQELVFSPNAGPQTDFLAAPEKEVLYGGAAGGGYAQVKITKYDNGLQSLKNEKFIINKLDNLYIFGAGHVGQELSSKSVDLDFNVHLIDSRNEYLKIQNKKEIIPIFTTYPWMLIKNLPKKSYYIVLTHSHDYDFKIINESSKKIRAKDKVEISFPQMSARYQIRHLLIQSRGPEMRP